MSHNVMREMQPDTVRSAEESSKRSTEDVRNSSWSSSKIE